MGYRTYYNLSTDQDDPKTYILPPAVDAALLAIEPELYEYCQGECVGWNDHEKDLRRISKDFPEMLFKLHYDGDEMGDQGYKYFRNGLMQDAPVVIVYPDFDPSKLTAGADEAVS